MNTAFLKYNNEQKLKKCLIILVFMPFTTMFTILNFQMLFGSLGLELSALKSFGLSLAFSFIRYDPMIIREKFSCLHSSDLMEKMLTALILDLLTYFLLLPWVLS